MTFNKYARLLSTLLLFVGIAVSSSAQNFIIIDSLKSLLNNAPIETKIQILNNIGWEYRLSKPDTTIFYSQQAYELALENEKPIDASVSLNYMGIAYGYKGDHVRSFFHYEQSVELFALHQDSLQLAYAYNNIGRLLFSQADMVKSYEYFTKALAIFERNTNLEGLGYTYQSLVRLYQSQQNLPKALEISKKALDIRVKTNNSRGQISSLKEIAEIYVEMHDYTSAHQQLDRARAIAIASNDIISLSEIDLGLSKVLYQIKNYGESLNYCKKAFEPASKNNNERLLLEINLQLAKIFYATKQFEKADEYLQLSIEKAKNTGLIEPLSEAYKYLYLTFEELEKYQQSLGYFKSYVTIKDSLYNADMARTIEKLENRLEIEQKDKENKLLKAKEEKNNELIDSEQNKSTAYMIATSLAVVTIVLLLFYLRQRIKHEKLLTSQKEYIQQQNEKINEQYNKLEKRNLELAEMNAEKDNLMNIVAHDLKSPFNNLKGLSQLVELSGELNEEQKNYIKVMREVSNKGANLTRDILDVNAFNFDNEELLSPKIINIHEFLQAKVDSFKTDSETKQITIQTFNTDKSIEFETDESSLSRILDNLISNSIKYSPENTAILLRSFFEQDKVIISVADQGPGFSIDDKKHVFKKFTRLSARPTGGESSNGLGLAIVKTLVGRIHGAISLVSDPGKGSEFIIKLPLKLTKDK